MARGSIGKRGESWRLTIELDADPMTGKRQRKTETFHGKKGDAEKRLTELLALADGKQLNPSSKLTVAAYLQRWLEDFASTKAPKTRQGYEYLINHYIIPHVGNVKLDKLAPSHGVRMLSTLREANLSASTLSMTYRCLRTALNVAVKWQLITRNPLDNVDAPRVPKKEMKTFDVDQAIAFLEASAAEGLKWQAFFTLALNTGSRPGELKALRWIDFNFDNATVHIQQSGQRILGVGRVVGSTKTTGSRRPIALGADVIALLRKHRAEQNQERLSMGPLWQDCGLVFASQVGTMLEEKALRRAFTRICERAGVPKIRPYDLRHSAASLLLAANVHPRVVAERLGHSNVSLTLNVYSHVLPGLQKDASATLEALLRKA